MQNASAFCMSTRPLPGFSLRGGGMCSTSQRRMTCATDLPYCAPFCVSTGLWKMSCFPSAKGAQASTSMPSACKASTCACRWWKELISIWFICGMVWLKIPKSTARSGVKLLTPMARTQPRRPGATLAARAVGGRGRASGQIGSIKKRAVNRPFTLCRWFLQFGLYRRFCIPLTGIAQENNRSLAYQYSASTFIAFNVSFSVFFYYRISTPRHFGSVILCRFAIFFLRRSIQCTGIFFTGRQGIVYPIRAQFTAFVNVAIKTDKNIMHFILNG